MIKSWTENAHYDLDRTAPIISSEALDTFGKYKYFNDQETVPSIKSILIFKKYVWTLQVKSKLCPRKKIKTKNKHKN